MKIKNRLLGFALMLLIPSMVVSAVEESGIKAGIESINAENGTLSVFISQNQGEVFDLGNTDIKVLLNEQELEVTDRSYVKDQEEPVSYYCMVDVSGSMDEERMNKVRTVLKQMVEGKKEQDIFCISTIGNTINNYGVSQDRDVINDMIDNITVTKEDTNLYFGITEIIKTMQKEEGIHNLRYCIVFSDGAEDQATGITREEVNAEIESSHIPVYTVAMLKTKANDKELESAKILGSFARKSIGGIHFTPTLDGYSYEELSERIKTAVETCIIVRANIGQPILEGTNAEVKVQGLMGTDTQMVLNVEKKMMQQAIVKPEQETNVEDITDSVEIAKDLTAIAKTNTRMYLYIGMIAAVLLVVVSILLIIIHNKKKKKEYANVNRCLEMEQPQIAFENNDRIAIDDRLCVLEKEEKSIRKTLYFVRMGIQESAEYEIPLADVYIVGRTEGACNLVIRDDVALSGQHCQFEEKDGEVYLIDLNSSNGTFVNGIPISEKFKLDLDDIIIIGSYEYRISW